MNCRHCKTKLKHLFIDLGYAPPSNAYLSKKNLTQAESYLPLKVKVCHKCWLVQTIDFLEAKSIFNAEYSYFSSVSKSWLKHAKIFSENIIKKLNLNKSSFVIEVASNDGYLLKNFVKKKIPCLGIEPTDSTAVKAEKLNIPVLRKFFGESLANQLVLEYKKADLIIGNNVFAHVPDINDFTKGLKVSLKPKGVITLEFPHLMRLIEHSQFDTIYHEHFSYLSLNTVTNIFAFSGLRVWHVEELKTHGGSLRIYGCHLDAKRKTTKSVNDLLIKEKKQGLLSLNTYKNFAIKANKIKYDLLSFLIKQKNLGNLVLAYGAAAKGNTLINYSGIKKDLIPYVFDASKFKQGKFLPGSHIPILSPDRLLKKKPKFILILPWNIANEIKSQYTNLKKMGVKFVTAIPELYIW